MTTVYSMMFVCIGLMLNHFVGAAGVFILLAVLVIIELVLRITTGRWTY